MRACVCSVDGELGTTTRDKGPPIWSRIIVRARPQRKRAAAGRQTAGRQASRQARAHKSSSRQSMHQLCFAAWARANFALFVRVAYGGVLHARFDKADYE